MLGIENGEDDEIDDEELLKMLGGEEENER